MYFVDRNKITTTLDYMNELLTIFETTPNWLANDVNKLALERLTHSFIEGMMDVGNAMIDGFIMRDPGSYEDIIDIMDDEEVIRKEMSEPLKEVVRLRDMIVRDYVSVDHEQLLQTMTKHLESLQLVRPLVNDYLENELGPVSAFLPEDDE